MDTLAHLRGHDRRRNPISKGGETRRSLYGLVRALRIAGARNVLVTLRPIGDASAAGFMESFYRQLLQQPPGRSDPSQALQATQRDILHRQPDFDWLPYVLFGE